jgi:D-xylose reductase
LNVQQKLVRFCQEQDIQVTAFSSFGAMSYVELNMAGLTDTLFEHETVKSIANRVDKTPA